MAQESEMQPIKVVCLGPCQLVGGKAGTMWAPLHLFDDPDLTYGDLRSRASAFHTKNKSFLDTGVYETTGIIEGDSIQTLNFNMRLNGTVQHPLRVEIAAKARSDEELKRSKNLEKRLKQEPILVGDMKNLRRAYDRMNYKEKIAFEQLVLQALRYGF